MNPSVSSIVGGLVIVMITIAAISFLPAAPAWALLGQIATSAARMLGAGP